MEKHTALKLASLTEKAKIYNSSQQVVDDGGTGISHAAQIELGRLADRLTLLADNCGGICSVYDMEQTMSVEARDVLPMYVRAVITFAAKQDEEFSKFLVRLKD